MANRDMRNPARSDNMCAASVMMARLPAKYPPVYVCVCVCVFARLFIAAFLPN